VLAVPTCYTRRSCRFSSVPRGTAVPVDPGELFIVHKNRRTAKCPIRRHQLGWELQLVIGAPLEIVQTQGCRSQDVLTTGEQWEAGLLAKGRT
jgi:hypothetical protein